MKLREVVKLIRGRRGTPVQLKVVSAEKIEPKVFDLTRQNIELKGQEARGEVIEQGKKADGTPYRIGVIDLPSFYADTKGGEGEAKSATEDVRKLLHGFNDKHVDGVILDLRRNGGGVLREAIALTGLFIDEGAVVQVRDSRGAIERGKKEEADKGMAYGGPLMVLVSRFSASASEILAGALQDYGRALIVGDSSTHGKGTVQVVRELGNLLREDPPPKIGAIKLTVQQFYRVNGDSTQNRGVVSDVVIPSLSEYLSNGEKELDNALAFDHIDPVTHDDMGMVPADVKAAVRARSAERVKKSADFAKLAKDIELLKARKARKIVPLNEQELKAQFSKDEADKAEKLENGLPPEAPPDAKYKFQRNFTNNEVLQIMEDFLQGRKLAQAR